MKDRADYMQPGESLEDFKARMYGPPGIDTAKAEALLRDTFKAVRQVDGGWAVRYCGKVWKVTPESFAHAGLNKAGVERIKSQIRLQS
jgi:hypothetical protein